jgi:FMN reductase
MADIVDADHNMRAGPFIVGLGGSTGAGSVTNRLLSDCLAMAAALGARTAAFAGQQLAGLPIFAASDIRPSAAADAIVEAVRVADAVVIATPGYHGAMSGLVKNALDHLEPLRSDARPYLDGRAVGVIVSAAGWQACGTTLVSVRSAIHALRGWPTPYGVMVNSAMQRPDEPRVRDALGLRLGAV